MSPRLLVIIWPSLSSTQLEEGGGEELSLSLRDRFYLLPTGLFIVVLLFSFDNINHLRDNTAVFTKIFARELPREQL